MTWKTGAAIVIYAILLSALSIAGPLWLRITSAANRVTEYAGDSGVYILTREEWSEITAGRNIQMDGALAESAGSGQSIFEYDPHSNGAKDYQDVYKRQA